jgi:hypothetical protein
MTLSYTIRLILLLAVFIIPSGAQAMTAQEILERVAKENFNEAFRIPLTVKTFKGNTLKSDHTMWLMGRTKDDQAHIFIEFDEPKEAKGLRFLFEIKAKEEPRAFMYLPATRKTLPLAMDDPSVDVGGTGLTMEDIQGFIPQKGEEETLLREEKAESRDCYVIQITLPDGKGQRLLWVSKNGYFVVKSQNMDPRGKVRRTFRVVEFFKTESGKEFPREEEIVIPDKNTKIKLRQDNAVFGIEIADEIMNPDTFGTYNWRN